MKRKLGIFVSSTYKDLIDERNAVSKAILASGNIPMGMELFTPNGKTTPEVIKDSIDNSDYMLLIIAGMYGSTVIDNGVEKSFTEMEYDYAVYSGKPVLLFFCEDVESLPAKKVESTAKKKNLLKKFLAKVNASNLLGKGWKDIKDLELKASQTLEKLKTEAETNLGWVRVKDISIAPENTEPIFFFTQEKRPSYSFFTTLAHNTSEIIIFMKTGVTLFSSYEKQLIEEIKSGCNLTFVTSRREYVSAIEGQKDLDMYFLNMDKVKQHLFRIENYSSYSTKLTILTIEYIPTKGIVYFKKNDGKEFILVQEYFISSRVGRDRPMFLLDKKDYWFGAYYEELTDMMSEGMRCKICDL